MGRRGVDATQQADRDETQGRVSAVPKRAVVIALALLVAFPLAPLLLTANPLASAIFNVLLAIVTTLASIYATRLYSARQTQDELTRYGLQAWRNLDSLSIKISAQLLVDPKEWSQSALEGYLLDIDEAKCAWRDLLRKVFELQLRLEAETEELSAEYKKRIMEAKDPAAKFKLEAELKANMARLLSRAPLPVKTDSSIACPYCSEQVVARVGGAPGDTAWPTCSNCGTKFSIHRTASGDVKVGGTARFRYATPCPSCNDELQLTVNQGQIEFVHICESCQTHLLFSGRFPNLTCTNLGVTNEQFNCPYCSRTSAVWISPGRAVRFVCPCTECGQLVQIEGQLEKFAVTKRVSGGISPPRGRIK